MKKIMPIAQKKFLILCAVAACLALLGPALAGASILGTAESFAVLGGSTVTNTGSTTINGNVGVYGGSSITGFPPGTVTNGTIHITDMVAQQAQSDVNTAYNVLAGMAPTQNLSGQDLGTLTLTAGCLSF